jgi:transcriptional regulator with GAF, ATPase, and Fis domain
MQAQHSIHSAASQNVANIEDVRVASLKVLALTLLHQIESREEPLASGATPELNLHTEVHHFEAALIRNALVKTGGRQRRAARLLGVKVTTLNTKIKRHNINLQPTT